MSYPKIEDLSTDYAVAARLGVSPEAHRAGPRGTLCDEGTRPVLERRFAEFDWAAADATAGDPAATAGATATGERTLL